MREERTFIMAVDSNWEFNLLKIQFYDESEDTLYLSDPVFKSNSHLKMQGSGGVFKMNTVDNQIQSSGSGGVFKLNIHGNQIQTSGRVFKLNIHDEQI